MEHRRLEERRRNGQEEAKASIQRRGRGMGHVTSHRFVQPLFGIQHVLD